MSGIEKSFEFDPVFDMSDDIDEEKLDPITDYQREKLDLAQQILGYRFENERLLLAAITHPSATEGKSVKFSYERLEFLGDSILGAIVSTIAFETYHDLDEGGLTRIKVALVSGASLSDIAEKLGFADIIVFGSSEAGTGQRGLHSALENVYESVVAALFLDGGVRAPVEFVKRTLIPHMTPEMANEPENPKSALQEKLQEDGITPTYKLIETQGPPHNRTFVAQVFAGSTGLARGTGRTKKEAESQAAKSSLARLSELVGLETDGKAKADKAAEKAAATAAARQAKADKAAEKAAATAAAKQAKADKAAAAKQAKAAERARKQNKETKQPKQAKENKSTKKSNRPTQNNQSESDCSEQTEQE